MQQVAKLSVLPMAEDDPDFVRALARGLAILESFNNAQDGLTLSAVAERSGLTRGSARRLLLTLEFLDYIGSINRRFFLRPRAMRIGQAYLSSQSLWSLAEQHLDDLLKITGQSCSLGVLDDVEVMYVARAAPKRLINNDIGIGTKLPAYANSMGKLLLAHLGAEALDSYLRRVPMRKLTPYTISSKTEFRRVLAAVRRNGYAISNQEIELGLQALAVPLTNQNGRVVAAVNITQYTSTMGVEELEQYLPILQKTAAEISKLISWHPQVGSHFSPR